MKSIRFIGDVHGRTGKYYDIVSNMDTDQKSIQIGDFGMGFISKIEANTVFPSEQHLFIRGNHDNPKICREHPNWIPDGTIEDKMMFIGGGYSIDHYYRVPGIDWWPDEELDDFEFENLLTAYEVVQPEVMITHECPSVIATKLFDPCKYNLQGMVLPDRTSVWFDRFWQIHKPKVWIFGHYHQRRDQNIHGTRFICLEELGYIDLNIEEME